ncbi:MAG: UDP-N-acetylmuramoyl-L-alanyl-D-glutamate--2,6-diaminopimelate ligase [Bacteroidetes bacterium]|nr:MAG: UDP-N-acetylmuramoyl-L-alanyl-D-glutamate--2,6-diaminopimelate ligase [Bacteroidota bacterium]
MKLLKDLLYDVRIDEIQGTTHLAVEGLSNDSRTTKPMGLFVAITGTLVDGHNYISQAILKGATSIVCEHIPSEITRPESVTFVIVKDSSSAIGHIASAYYDFPTHEMKVVAVTGTNGKTTIVTLLHRLFRMLDKKTGLIGTVEHRINDKVEVSAHTTPDALTLQALFHKMVLAGCKICFIEASSHAIDQNRLSGTRLSGAVFTNITHDHLDYHKTFDNYITAKKKLFDGLPSNAFAIVNSDESHFEDIISDCKADVSTFGLTSMADNKGRIIENQLQGLHLHIDGQDLYSRLVGEFNASNLLAIYSVAKLLNVDPLNALTQMSLLTPPPGRFEIVESPDGITAIVDYAHTPDALENVLSTISTFRSGGERLITVVGCGGDRDVTKRPIMAQVAAFGSDQVFLTSDNPRTEDPNDILAEMQSGLDPKNKRKCISITDRKEAIRAAAAFAESGDIIVVAGKGHETYQEINGIRHDFDDRVILREAFTTA